MRLCLVISSLSAGGAERVMSLLANEWVARGHSVDLLTTHDRGATPHYHLCDGVALRSIDPAVKGPLKQPAVIRALRGAIVASRPDVVISFLNYTNILTLLACRGLNCPVIISERLDPRVVGIGPLWSTLRRLTYRHAACLVAQTPTAARLYECLAPGRVRVIPNPVCPPGGAPIEPIAWPAPDRPTIIAVGRLQPQKGFDVAIRAMAVLGARHPEWRLVILGEGPLRQDLERLRTSLGMEERVLLPGRVPDPWPWLARAQIFLMSSHSEGFPNALCEAMAAGLPCVSTDCPSGPSDIITHDVDGLLVPPGNTAAMADALAALIDSPDRRVLFGRAATAIVDRYSLGSVIASWDQALAEITAGPA